MFVLPAIHVTPFLSTNKQELEQAYDSLPVFRVHIVSGREEETLRQGQDLTKRHLVTPR